MPTNSPRIYVSALEVDAALVAKDPGYVIVPADEPGLFTHRRSEDPSMRVGAFSQTAIAAVRRLRESGIDVIWHRDFWDYPTIEAEIASCSGLLAVTDAYYFSSTGKLIELTYAGGQFAHTSAPIAPIPIFMVAMDASYMRHRALESPGTWTILQPEASAVVAQVHSVLAH